MNTWQKLKWLILSGVTESIGEHPVNRLRGKPVSENVAQTVVHEEHQRSDSQNQVLSERAKVLADGAKTLEELYSIRQQFDGCPLKKTAAHTVNGRGGKQPIVLCFVETPDAADDKTGTLMSGEVGALLDKMLKAIGLDLTQNAYVSSLTPWRPPGNRKLTELEQAVCRPFWEKEIQLLKPRVILLFGGNVAEVVLGNGSLSKMRGKWHAYGDIPVRVSIAPATLIKMPTQKRQAWDDLQQVQTQLNKVP